LRGRDSEWGQGKERRGRRKGKGGRKEEKEACEKIALMKKKKLNSPCIS
jgi:hypothetical protein